MLNSDAWGPTFADCGQQLWARVAASGSRGCAQPSHTSLCPNDFQQFGTLSVTISRQKRNKDTSCEQRWEPQADTTSMRTDHLRPRGRVHSPRRNISDDASGHPAYEARSHMTARGNFLMSKRGLTDDDDGGWTYDRMQPVDVAIEAQTISPTSALRSNRVVARARRRRRQSCTRAPWKRQWTTHLLLAFAFAIALLCTLVRAAEPIIPTTSSSTAAPASTAAPTSGAANASSTGVLTSIPSSVPNGGITILQPQQTAAQSYYKIASGSNVTFAWNFTDVLKYPTSLVVAAYCSENSNTYTITSSLPGTATSVVWSPYDFDQSAARVGQAQLIQATYRLQITDERGLNVAASPGLFSPNSKVTFALFQPRPYIPISEGWSCASCNAGAMLRIPHRTMLLVIAMAASAATLL